MTRLPFHRCLCMTPCYLYRFIRSTYTDRSPSDEYIDHSGISDGCDMYTWTERMCAYYVAPRELCCAVFNCGLEYSAMAFNAPQPIIDRCRLNMTAMDVGRKRAVPPSDHVGDMCTDTGETFGRRSSADLIRELENITPPPGSTSDGPGLHPETDNYPVPTVVLEDVDIENASIEEPELNENVVLENDTVWFDENESNYLNDSGIETDTNTTDVSEIVDNTSNNETEVEYIVYTNTGNVIPGSTVPLDFMLNLKLRSRCYSLST